jgi:hypothetical protein
MAGLAKIRSNLRRRPVWERFVLGGFERLTEWLMSGDEVGETDLEDLRALRMRVQGFDRALTAREAAAGINEITET